MVSARHLAALILPLAAAGLPAAASAQERPVTLAPRVTEPPEVGVSRAGDAVVAWFAPADTSNAQQRGLGAILVAWRDANGRFGAPRRLAPGGYLSHEFALAVGSAGDAAIVVRRRGSFRRPGGRVLVARRAPGGRFGPLRRVPGVKAVDKPAAAIGPDGTLLIAWLTRAPTTGCSRVVHAASARRGEPLGGTRRISGPCPQAGPPQAALGRGGRGAVVWLEGDYDNGSVVVASASGGRLREPVTLTRGLTGDSRAFRLAGSDDGRALVVWREPIAPTFPERPGRVFAAEVGLGVRTRPVAVSASDNILAHASVAVAPSGAAVVAWQEADWTHSSVVVARRAAGSDAFSAPEVVHPCGVDVQLWRGAIADVASDGAAAIGFHSSCLHRPTRTAPTGLGIVRAPAGASFGPALPLGSVGRARRIRIALADAGPGIVVWTQRERLQALGL